jgi:hypothetical protein
MGPAGVIQPGSNWDYSVNRGLYSGSGTPWARLWADWPSMQPEASRAPDTGSGAFRVSSLDSQVAKANADGRPVILTAYRFPSWANGTASLTPEQDATYQLEDRKSKGGDPAGRKALTFKLPTDLSQTGAWGRWIDWLMWRYNRNNGRRKGIVTALELFNEPNVQLWPQQGASLEPADPYGSGALTIQRAVATMFQTAQAIQARYGGEPVLAGPAVGDSISASRVRTAYSTFTTALLDELQVRGFTAGAKFVWTHHNYTDTEYDQGAGSQLGRTTNRAADVRRQLVGRWRGWPAADVNAPGAWLTEGGARLDVIAKNFALSDPAAIRAKQAELIGRNWDRMYLGADGAGISMVSVYLFYTAMGFDCGLCELDGTPRPSYSTWGKLPAIR